MALLRFFFPDVRAQLLAKSICCALAILFSGTLALAQSGRAPRPHASPPALPAPSDTKVKAPEAQPRQAASSLIIVNSVNSAKGTVWTSTGLSELVERLKESPYVKVTQADKEMSRKQAIELAKAQADAYVVWIQFDVDASMGRIDRDVQAPIVTGINPGCLLINYVVLAPGTAQVKGQHRVYQDGYQAVCTRAGGELPKQTTDPNHRPVAETLRKAAREAADRIIKDSDIRSRVALLETRPKANLSDVHDA